MQRCGQVGNSQRKSCILQRKTNAYAISPHGWVAAQNLLKNLNGGNGQKSDRSGDKSFFNPGTSKSVEQN